MNENIKKAVQEYRLRQKGLNLPAGSFDCHGRFHLNETEMRPCCRSIARPNMEFPLAQKKHACSARHVAALFGISEKALRDALKQSKSKG